MAAIDRVEGKDYVLYRGDCCKVVPGLPANSVGMCVHSPPFASLYSYTDSLEDMGNSKTYEEFFAHYGFLVSELQRIMMPGRVVAVHCMDLPTHKSSGEEIGLRDFPGDIIRCYEKFGFIYHSRHCIWKNPLVAATRTKALGLAHKQLVKDSAISRMGIADTLLAFRKKGENPKPIPHSKGLTEYHGSNPPSASLDRYLNHEDTKTNKRSHAIWQAYASPVWMDIRQTRTLQHTSAKDPDDEKHVAPLQLDVIERCMTLWSAPGDVVLSPFLGIGSEIYVAVKNGRKGVGVELKPRYFRLAVKNVEAAVRKREERLK